METVLEIKLLRKNKVGMDVVTSIIEYCKKHKIEIIVNDKVVKVVK